MHILVGVGERERDRVGDRETTVCRTKKDYLHLPMLGGNEKTNMNVSKKPKYQAFREPDIV